MRGAYASSSMMMPRWYTPRHAWYTSAAVVLLVVLHLLSGRGWRGEGGGGGDGGGGDGGGWARPRSKFFDARGNGDPSGLSFAPGASERRAAQLDLFQQKLDWRASHPIDNVTFGFLYYLGSPTPGAVQQQYVRELSLSIQALGCSSFEEKNVVVMTDTIESRDQLQSALQGVGKGGDEDDGVRVERGKTSKQAHRRMHWKDSRIFK